MKNEITTTNISDEFKLQIEAFIDAINKPPRKTKTDQKKGIVYITISEIEVLLDTIFFGQWQTEITQCLIVGNEIVMNIKLGIFHPITQQWIWRAGTASAMIRQVKDAKISDIDSKIKNAVEMDAPHAKASAIKNAAQSLGNMFGRNLRRKQEDQTNYNAIHTPRINKKNEQKEA